MVNGGKGMPPERDSGIRAAAPEAGSERRTPRRRASLARAVTAATFGVEYIEHYLQTAPDDGAVVVEAGR
jgi:hypothetical protein